MDSKKKGFFKVRSVGGVRFNSTSTKDVVENAGNKSVPNIVEPVSSKLPTAETAQKVIDTSSTWMGPVDSVQMLMEYVVETQHVPFWLAIVGFTVVVRATIMPLTVMAYKSAVRSVELGPEVRLFTAKISEAAATGGEARLLATRQFQRWKKEKNYNPIFGLVPGLAQVPFFICLFLSIRRFAYELKPDEFLNGGILWFHDLSQSDPYWRMPVLSGIATFLLTEVTFLSILLEPQKKD